MIQKKRQLDMTIEESMDELVKEIKKPEPPMGDAQ